MGVFLLWSDGCDMPTIAHRSTLTQQVHQAPFVYVPAVSRGTFLGIALNKMCSDLGATASDVRDFQSTVMTQGGVFQIG
jgi:hypothetical protein